MLTLLIKKEWFEMIRSGEKKEEYREIKPYYITRFIKWLGFPSSWARRYAKHPEEFEWFFKQLETEGTCKSFKKTIVFRNGYSHDAPALICECGLRIGFGRTELGAESDKKYFILEIKNIM